LITYYKILINGKLGQAEVYLHLRVKYSSQRSRTYRQSRIISYNT